MLDELGIARERHRQLMAFLDDFVKKGVEKAGSQKEFDQLVNFLLDEINKTRRRIKRLESKNN